jgi:hypothetical protein
MAMEESFNSEEQGRQIRSNCTTSMTRDQAVAAATLPKEASSVSGSDT